MKKKLRYTTVLADEKEPK